MNNKKMQILIVSAAIISVCKVYSSMKSKIKRLETHQDAISTRVLELEQEVFASK